MSHSTPRTKTLEPTAPRRQVEQRRAGKPKVLIVEDHNDTREMLHAMLEIWGFRVVEACDGLEAVESAWHEHPDLILMDGSLPLLDGLAATRRIRENAGLREVVIVALNGWGTPEYNTAALAAGCNECIVKPFEFERLESCLTSLLNRLPIDLPESSS